MNKYVVTYKQGGAVNQKKSIMATTEKGAVAKFRKYYPTAGITEVRLVMREN